jgi:cytochrome c2
MMLLLFAVACRRESHERGRELIAQYGCNTCHSIPGIEGQQGSIGPSLEGIGARRRISRNSSRVPRH